jgi:hypothetical protein
VISLFVIVPSLLKAHAVIQGHRLFFYKGLGAGFRSAFKGLLEKILLCSQSIDKKVDHKNYEKISCSDLHNKQMSLANWLDYQPTSDELLDGFSLKSLTLIL